MIGLAFSNDIPSVAAPGSSGPVLGSNPFAYAVPAGRERPMFLDISTAAVAGGKVFRAQAFGHLIPAGWLVDHEGAPTIDPVGYPSTKTLLPMAAHKGYGLALMIEVLSGVLTGAAVTRKVGSWMSGDSSLPTGHGAAFIAIDVGAVFPLVEFKARVDLLVAECRSAPLAKGATRIYVPGEIEWERRDKALAEGIELPGDVVANLEALADDLSMPMIKS